MHPSLSVLLAFLALVLVVSIPQSVDEAPHSAYQEGSAGLGHLFDADRTRLTFEGETVRLLHGDLKDLHPRQEALLVVAPRLPYQEHEVNDLESFLRQGGRLLLAEDRGTGRALLEGLDVGLEIPEGRIFSTSYQESPTYPVAEATDALPGLPATVPLHEPRPVTGNTGTALLVAHELSWLDRNHNGRPDLDEPRQAWPLAVRTDLGAGQLVVVGDPDLLTEAMAARPGVQQTQQALLQWLTEDGRRTLVVDEGHRATLDPLGAAPIMAGDAPIRATGILLAAALATGLTAFRIRLKRVTPRRRPPVYGQRPPDAWERAVLRELPRK